MALARGAKHPIYVRCMYVFGRSFCAAHRDPVGPSPVQINCVRCMFVCRRSFCASCRNPVGPAAFQYCGRNTNTKCVCVCMDNMIWPRAGCLWTRSSVRRSMRVRGMSGELDPGAAAFCANVGPLACDTRRDLAPSMGRRARPGLVLVRILCPWSLQPPEAVERRFLRLRQHSWPRSCCRARGSCRRGGRVRPPPRVMMRREQTLKSGVCRRRPRADPDTPPPSERSRSPRCVAQHLLRL